MDIFNLAFQWILSAEGGYVNNPNDPGGETKYGISKRSYPNLDIANLTVDEAREIYLTDFWQRYQCDKMPKNMALAFFDLEVDSGPITAIDLLQKSCGVQVDGILGPETLAAILPSTLTALMTNRILFLMQLNSFEIFGKGWLNRINNLMYFIGASSGATYGV